MKRFREKVEKTGLTPSGRTDAVAIAEQLLSVPYQKGIPVGPALSHVLGNIAMERVDSLMIQKYPGRYFRYVDDLVIVASRDRQGEVHRELANALGEESLVLNETKTDVVSREQWVSHSPTTSPSEGLNAFNVLVNRLKIFLARRPQDFETIRHVFRSEGFSLPLGRLRSVSEYSPFRRFVRVLWRTTGFREKFALLSDSPESLLKLAEHSREVFWKKARELQTAMHEQEGMARRWQLQQIRFVFNRLMFLVDRSEYGRLLELLPQVEETAQIRLVANALMVGDATPLLVYPGPALHAFGLIWNEVSDTNAEVSWPNAPGFPERDSLATLAAYGVCQPPEAWVEEAFDGASLALVGLVSGHEIKRNPQFKFTFLDELVSLTSALSQEERQRFMTTRFDDDEDVFLSGLGGL